MYGAKVTSKEIIKCIYSLNISSYLRVKVSAHRNDKVYTTASGCCLDDWLFNVLATC